MSVVTPVVGPEALQRRVAEMADEITERYAGHDPLLLAVLQGAVPFVADLCRHLRFPLDVDFLSLTRFGRQGRVGIRLDSGTSLQGRHVIVVEELVDTGLTLSYLLGLLRARDPASLEAAALIDKTRRRIVEVPLAFRGFEVGDEYLIGYGLDWEGRFRNLPGLWAVLDLPAFQADPEAIHAGVFGEAGDTVGA